MVTCDMAHGSVGRAPFEMDRTIDGCACKFCNRSRMTLNPLVHNPAPDNAIPWRRAGGRECAICYNVIQADPELRNMPRGDIENLRRQDPDFHIRFMKKVSSWEAIRRSGGRQPRSQGPKLETRVTAIKEGGIELKKKLGWFWPSELYKNIKGVAPAARDLHSMCYNGKPMRGVVLDESHGTPVGVIEMSEVSRTAIQKSSLVADTEAAFNP